jgi:hypothetical protein
MATISDAELPKSSKNTIWCSAGEEAEEEDDVFDDDHHSEKETRGFEQYSLERAQIKQIAARCTRSAQKKGINEAAISSIVRHGRPGLK